MYIKTRYTDENGCVLCDNVKNQDGYVRVRPKPLTKHIMLHVYEWEKVNGTKPEGTELNHLCGNRGCCNLEHLELICGSKHATLTNAERKGYIKFHRSDEDISKMYERVVHGKEAINQMCREFGIKRSTLSSIINKKSKTTLTNSIDKKYSEIH